MNRDHSEARRFLPLGVDLRGKDCLVVGGGNIGTRKAVTLAQVGAIVTVVSPVITDALAELIDAGRVLWRQETFRDDHMSGAFLAVAATDDDAVNAAVVAAATRSGALACDASSPARSKVIFGALLASEELTIAVFTGGRDPSLARRTRDRIAADILGEREKTEPEA